MTIRLAKLHGQAFSLMEMIIAIAIVGILSAIAVQSMGTISEAARQTVAGDKAESLNNGVKAYVQIESIRILSVPADDTATTDEFDVLRALQWEDSSLTGSNASSVTGAPYVDPLYNPVGSASTEDYRLVWNGDFFVVREPGVDGAGLKMDFEGTDLGKPVSFPDGFVPLSKY